MKTKRLLFGLIEMNVKLYNILYTLLCVCVLLITNISLMFALCKIYDTPKIFDLSWYWLTYSYAQTLFIMSIMIKAKKHYA
jgi:hypothetical protein